MPFPVARECRATPLDDISGDNRCPWGWLCGCAGWMGWDWGRSVLRSRGWGLEVEIMQFPGWVRAHDHCYAEHVAGSGEDRDFHWSGCRDLEL